jgi:hypothetical protein
MDGRRMEVMGMVKTNGQVNVEKVSIALRELTGTNRRPDKVVIGGPGNCLVEHGKEGQRGFRPERKVTVKKDMVSRKKEREVSYHMMEPRRISMCERRELVDGVVVTVREVLTVFLGTEVWYVTVFPRFVDRCCAEHMTGDDVVVMDGIRRDVDRDVMETVKEQDGRSNSCSGGRCLDSRRT